MKESMADQETRRELASLRRLLQQVERELRAVRGQAAYLAKMGGGCPLCFGQDPDCPECRGKKKG